jgi:hypothetical protein
VRLRDDLVAGENVPRILQDVSEVLAGLRWAGNQDPPTVYAQGLKALKAAMHAKADAAETAGGTPTWTPAPPGPNRRRTDAPDSITKFSLFGKL